LGYFSIVGLLRVHVLLGDFTLALKVMENVELNQKVGIHFFEIVSRLGLNADVILSRLSVE